MMSIDAVLYLLLALYIEAVFPGEFGVPQPWYFPLTVSYFLQNPTKIELEVTHISHFHLN